MYWHVLNFSSWIICESIISLLFRKSFESFRSISLLFIHLPIWTNCIAIVVLVLFFQGIFDSFLLDL
jgi:hypothetical protein